jgi:hypothetical protein
LTQHASGITVLEFPRVLSGKTVIFDAHFFMDDPDGEGFEGISLLRYFNHNDWKFRGMEKFFVIAEVSNESLKVPRSQIETIY